jgi:hypothetical protein
MRVFTITQTNPDRRGYRGQDTQRSQGVIHESERGPEYYQFQQYHSHFLLFLLSAFLGLPIYQYVFVLPSNYQMRCSHCQTIHTTRQQETETTHRLDDFLRVNDISTIPNRIPHNTIYCREPQTHNSILDLTHLIHHPNLDQPHASKHPPPAIHHPNIQISKHLNILTSKPPCSTPKCFSCPCFSYTTSSSPASCSRPSSSHSSS